MSHKADPFSTRLHYRIDAILLVLTVIVIALIVLGSLHGQSMDRPGAVTLTDGATTSQGANGAAPASQNDLSVSRAFVPERRNDFDPALLDPHQRTSGGSVRAVMADAAIAPVTAVADITASTLDSHPSTFPVAGVSGLQLGAASLLSEGGAIDIATVLTEDAAARAAKARAQISPGNAGTIQPNDNDPATVGSKATVEAAVSAAGSTNSLGATSSGSSSASSLLPSDPSLITRPSSLPFTAPANSAIQSGTPFAAANSSFVTSPSPVAPEFNGGGSLSSASTSTASAAEALNSLTMDPPVTEPDAILADQTWVGGGTGNNTGWTTGTNWSGGAVPGSTSTTTNTDIATIPATGTNPALGISGTATQYLGALDFTSTANRAIGSSGTTGGSLTMQLNGATVNGVANTIIRASNTGNLTLQANNGQGTPNTLSLALGNTTNNIINIDSSGGVNIGVAITGSGKNLTLNGGSTGILTFSGSAANTYSGTTTVNVGELDLNKTAAIDAIAGSLVVGDGTGSANTATVKLLAANQINNASNVTVNGDGLLSIGANSDTVGAVILDGGSISGTGGTLTGSGYDFRSGSASAILGGSGITLTKSTGGMVTLSGANTYTGTTTVSAGSLFINGDQSSATGAVSVSNTGTLLGGTGTIGGAVTINAGANITGATNGTVGTLTMASAAFSGVSLSLATFVVDIIGAASDTLNITGLLDLSGLFDALVFNGTPDGVTAYLLATYGSISGTFDSFVAFAGYEYIYGTNSLVLSPLTPVPEPGTWAAGILTVAFLIWALRSVRERRVWLARVRALVRAS